MTSSPVCDTGKCTHRKTVHERCCMCRFRKSVALGMKTSSPPPYNIIHFGVVAMVISMQYSNLTAAPQTQALNPAFILLVLNVFIFTLKCVTLNFPVLHLGLWSYLVSLCSVQTSTSWWEKPKAERKYIWVVWHKITFKNRQKYRWFKKWRWRTLWTRLIFTSFLNVNMFIYTWLNMFHLVIKNAQSWAFFYLHWAFNIQSKYMAYAVFVSFCPKAELYGPTVVFPGWHK